MNEEAEKQINSSENDIKQESEKGNIFSADPTLNEDSKELKSKLNHPDSGNQKVLHHIQHQKNWKNYIWEFLMLFFAVFCGFLADYQLDAKIERDKESQYMTSLYQDLKTDTLNMSVLLKSITEDISNYDSLFDIFRSKKYLKETSDAYYYGRKLVTLRPFYPTDGTITQLENSGGLRLIKSRAVVDSLQSYKLAVSFLKSVQEFERQHFELARSLIGKIFDANVFDIMMGDGSNPLGRPDKNYPLMPFMAADLNDFHIPLNFIKRNKITQIALMKRLQKRASDLMQLIKDKYRLDL